jgi:hypothetical protein
MSADKTEVATLRESGQFDAAWYLAQYPDVAQLQMDPAEHYLWIGRRLGRAGCEAEAGSAQLRQPRAAAAGKFSSFGPVRHLPLVSLLIVSFNSGKDLRRLLPTIAKQTYRAFEVVVVENGSEDTEALCRSYFPDLKYTRADNVGFAAANNLAMELSAGEFFALVNPDTRLEPETLQHLVDAARIDCSVAAVVPKINFFAKFVRLSISADVPFSLSREDLLNGLEYRKIFVRAGSDDGERLSSDRGGCLELDLPFETERQVALQLTGEVTPRKALVRLGHAPELYFTASTPDCLSVDLAFDASAAASARYMVNNAGSALHPDGMPFDRGFAEYDDGLRSGPLRLLRPAATRGPA